MVGYRVACWLGAGLWSSWTLAGVWWLASPGTPWSVPSAAVLGIGVLAAGLTGLGFQRAEEAQEQRQIDVAQAEGARVEAAEAQLPAHEQIAAKWQRLLRQITRRQVTVVNVEFWEPNTGFTLDVDLPADGTTIDDIKPHEKSLATAGNVPPGCGVEILDSPAGGQQILIRIGTEDALAEDHHLPDNHEPDSINNDLSIGIVSDRTDATINVRFNCGVLVGQVDSGKSNQLNVISRRIAACTDALIVVIDESGNGRFPRPWIRAWYEGRAKAPTIAAVAPNPLWSLLLTQSLIQIIDGRTAEYADLMHREGSDKIMPRPELPQIILLVDEFGKLSLDVKDNIKTISDTGRGAAVRVVSCALEATERYIPRALIAQSRERMGMRVSDEAQLQYLFDNTWKSGRFEPKSLIHKGSGLSSSGGALPEKLKGWRMEPAQIDRDSIALAGLRPELDDISLALGDTVAVQMKDSDGVRVTRRYEGVWSRHWEQVLPIIFPSGQPAASAAAARPTVTVAEPGAGQRAEAQAGGLAAASASLDEKLAAARRAADEADQGGPGEPATGDGEPSPQRGPGDPNDPLVAELHAMTDQVHPRRRMRQLVADPARNINGIGPGPIHKILLAEGYDTVYQTVVGWMKEDTAAGILTQPGGQRAPNFPGPNIGDPYADEPGQ